MTWARRYDRGQLRAPVRRADGTLLVEGFAAREGVLVYRRADGTERRELVTTDTLVRSADGLARAPVTLDHPGEDVTPENVSRYGVGDTDGEVTVHDDGFVRVKLAVRRRDAVDAVDAGRQELSPGYDVRLDETPGEHPVHGPYDAEQIERRYNHLAIVDRARGGAEVRLRADSDDAVVVEPITRADSGAPTPKPSKEARMNPRVAALLALVGLSSRFDSDDDALDALADHLKTRRSDAEDMQEKYDAMKAKYDELMAKADKLKADMAEMKAEEKKKADAAEREALVKVAEAFEVKTDGVELPELKVAVAQAYMGDALREDASDAYVEAALDMARRDAESRTDAAERAASAWRSTVDTNTDTPTKRDDANRPSALGAAWLQTQRGDK